MLRDGRKIVQRSVRGEEVDNFVPNTRTSCEVQHSASCDSDRVITEKHSTPRRLNYDVQLVFFPCQVDQVVAVVAAAAAAGQVAIVKSSNVSH